MENTKGRTSCRMLWREHISIARSSVVDQASASSKIVLVRNSLALSVGTLSNMVDIRLNASKQRDRGKRRAVEDPLVRQDNSPVLSSRENSVGPPLAPQFVATKELGKALSQVQEAVIRGVCKKMKVPECQPGTVRGLEHEPTLRYVPPY